MDAFGDLLSFGAGGRKPPPTPADIPANLFDAAAAPAAGPSSGFSFLNPGATAPGTATGHPPATAGGGSSPAPSSGFDFLYGGPPQPLTPAPAASAFPFVSPTASAPTPPPSTPYLGGGGFQAAALDTALSSVGWEGAGNATLAPLGTAASGGATATSLPPGTDVSTWSGAQLKRFLDERRVDHRACVEKADLVALVQRIVGGAGGGVTVPGAAGASRPSEWKPTGPKSALAVGMPNAFELHGLSHVAVAASTTTSQEKQYEAAVAGHGGVGDAASFFAASRRLPLGQMVIPHAPPARLRVRVPATVVNPLLREVTLSYLADCATELSAAPALLAAATAGPTSTAAPPPPSLSPGQRAIIPHLGCTLLGPRRVFEVLLRTDVPDGDVLDHLAAAGKDVGMEVMHRTGQSVMLQQRISVPTSAFSAFVGSPAVVGTTTPTGTKWPVVVTPPPATSSGGGVDAGATLAAAASWLMDTIGGNRLYVNSLAVYLGANPHGQRAALLACARFLPDPTPPTSASGEGGTASSLSGVPVPPPSQRGRILFKDKVGGTILGVATGVAGADAPVKPAPVISKKSGASTAAVLLSDLVSTGAGITCTLVDKLVPPKYGYRGRGGEDGPKLDGGSGAPQSSRRPADDDPFGLTATVTSPASMTSTRDDDDGGGSALSSAEAAVLRVDALPEEVAPFSPAATALVTRSGDAAAAVGNVVSLLQQDGHRTGCADWEGGVDGVWTAAFDDGAAVVDQAGGAGGYRTDAIIVPATVEWSHLRVSFLDVDMPAPVAPATSGGSGGRKPGVSTLSADLASLSLGASAHTASHATSSSANTFEVARLGDELVALSCEWAAAVRSHPVSLESAWVDAVRAAKQDCAQARGEALVDATDTGGSGTSLWQGGGVGSDAGGGGGHAPAPTAPAVSPETVFAAHDVLAPRPVAKVDDLFHLLDMGGAPSPAAPAPASASAVTPTLTSTTVAPLLTQPIAVATPANASPPSSHAMTTASGGHTTPRFVLHPDTAAAMAHLYRQRGESKLFTAASALEARARVDEWLASQVIKALAATFHLHHMTPATPHPLPRLDQVPLPPLPGSEEGQDGNEGPVDLTPGMLSLYTTTDRMESAAAACCEGKWVGGGSTTSNPPVMILPPGPPGMTAGDDTLREVYHRAYSMMRAQQRSVTIALACLARDADVNMARRMMRKRNHVALRCAAAFYHAASVVSTLQQELAATPVVSDPGRALLTSQFGVQGEASLLHLSATAVNQLGEAVITPYRIVFHANTLGFHTKRNIPFDTMVAISKATNFMVDAAVTITYVDDDKVAAKRAKAATMPATAKPVTTTATGTGSMDLFAGLNTAAAPATLPPAVVTVKDAFDAMCEIDGAVPPTPPATATMPAPASGHGAPPSAGGGGVSTSGGTMLDGLTEHDMMVFLSSGGAVDTLSQLILTPTTVDRDGLYYLLHFLRQCDTRSHERTFAFRPIGGPLLPTLPQANSVRVTLPDMHDYIVHDMDGKGQRAAAPAAWPLLLRRDALAQQVRMAAGGSGMAAGGGGKGSKAPTATQSLLDDAAMLFARAPDSGGASAKPAPSPAAAVVDIYADLADTFAADAI